MKLPREGARMGDLNRRDWDRFIQERSSGRLRPQKAQRKPVGARTVARDLKRLLAVLNWDAETQRRALQSRRRIASGGA